MAFEVDASGNQIYIGWSQPGLSKALTGWRIMKQVFDSNNNLTDTQWPENSTAFNFVWSLRTTYSYGIADSAYAAFALISPNGTRWVITVLPPNGNLYSVAQLTGPADVYEPSGITLRDSSGGTWDLFISNAGNLITTPGTSGTVLQSLSLYDSVNTNWTLTVSITGDLTTTEE